MSQGIIVRKCERLDEFHRCVDLQREIWGEAELEVEPATMFVVAAHTGGEVLGAFCREYQPNLYGVTTSPLHRGLETDRLLVEWHLDSPRVVAAIEDLVKDPVEAPAVIELPPELERWQQEDSPQVSAVQKRLREEFTKWFAKGYAAVALRTGQGKRAYLLRPWSEF